MFDIQKDLIAKRTYDAFIELGGILDTKKNYIRIFRTYSKSNFF